MVHIKQNRAHPTEIKRTRSNGYIESAYMATVCSWRFPKRSIPCMQYDTSVGRV